MQRPVSNPSTRTRPARDRHAAADATPEMLMSVATPSPSATSCAAPAPSAASSPLSLQLLSVADGEEVAVALRELCGAVQLHEAERAGIEDDALRLCAELRSFATAMSGPADEESLYRSLAIVWLELRFEWQRHSLVANYDTARTGSAEIAVLVRASAATYLLQRIEVLLERAQLERLVETAMGIIENLRSDVSRVCARIAA